MGTSIDLTRLIGDVSRKDQALPSSGNPGCSASRAAAKVVGCVNEFTPDTVGLMLECACMTDVKKLLVEGMPQWG
jgi:hypothetical protein